MTKLCDVTRIAALLLARRFRFGRRPMLMLAEGSGVFLVADGAVTPLCEVRAAHVTSLLIF
jgi:hypothetical protein